jgi:RluA family pseudouridine synthase
MIFTSEAPRSVRQGTLFVQYLADRFTYHNRAQWESLVKNGKVTLNGRIVSAAHAINPGDTITYDAGDFEEPPADLNYRIIYEDEWLLGIDKPGNLLVHRAGRSFRNNLIYQLRVTHDPPYPECHSIHRLDRETSGVVLVAKNAASLPAFGRMLSSGGMVKTYRAIVSGTPQPQEITLAIGKHDTSAISYKFRVSPLGKPSITRIIASKPLGNGRSLLTIEPVTGRTHQIRIHCAAIGSPILGDKLYGMTEEEYLAWRSNPENMNRDRSLPRQALHCASLAFLHPFTQKPIRIEAPMPEDMARIAAG